MESAVLPFVSSPWSLNGAVTQGTVTEDERWMDRALTLAARGVGRTSPNPVVGAVIVKDGRFIAEGFHRRAGLPHAEAEALQRAGPLARGATLYVTLEPCNHTGRTPPCCDAIIASGIARVVAAVSDPNPITRGRGFARLRRAGIAVTTGVRARAAAELNAPFWSVMTTGLPWVIAKVGQSLDGKIATRTGASRWITSPGSRRLGHAWRSRVDAVLVGINTVLVDDPRLTVRGASQRPGRPIRVIVDSRLRTPLGARCLQRASTPTLIATTISSGARLKRFHQRGVEVLSLPAQRGRVPLTRLCRELARRGIHSLLIEGGGEVVASAFAERLVRRVVWCIAPRIIGGRSAPSAVSGAGIGRLTQAVRLDDVTVHRLGPDLCIQGDVHYPPLRDRTRDTRQASRSRAPHVTCHLSPVT